MRPIYIKYIRAILFVLIIISSYGISKLQLNYDVFKLLPSTPSTQNLKQYNSIFSSLEKLSITIVNEKKDIDRLFEAAEYVVKKLKPHPFFNKISYKLNLLSTSQIKDFYEQQLPNLLTQKDLTQTDISKEFINKRVDQIFEQLVEVGPVSSEIRSDPLQLSHLFWKKLQISGLLNAKIVKESLVSKDDRAILLHIPKSTTYLSVEQTNEIWKLLYKLKKDLRDKYKGTNLVCIGGKRVMLDNTSAIWRDVQLTSSLATITLAIMMLLVLKNFFLFPLLFLPVAFGIFVSIGISSLFAPQLSIITLGFGSVLIGISVDYVVHYIFHFEHSNTQEMEFKIFRPMSFAALSTCGAIFFLFFSHFPVHVETAWVVGCGILSSFLFVVGIFPQICNSIVSKTNKRQPFINLPMFLQQYSQKKGGFIRSATIVVISIGITVVAGANIAQLKFIGDIEQFNHMQKQTKEDEEKFFSIWGNQQGKIAIITYNTSFEEALKANEKICSFLEAQTDAKILTNIHNLLPSIDKMKKNHAYWKNYWTVEKQQEIKNKFQQTCAQYGFSKNAFEPFFSSMQKPIQPKSTQHLLQNDIFYQIIKNQIKKHENKWYIQNIIKAPRQTIQKMQTKLKNLSILIVDRKQILTDVSVSLINWTYIATIFIALYVLVLFFSYFIHIELVIIGLFPLILSLFWILGLMAYWQVPLNLFNALMVVFVFGLGVDYTTFLVTSYTECIGKKQNFLHTTRAAIFLSALTTLIAFGVLITAEHPALKSLGICVLLAMTTVLFNTVFLAPIILRYFIPPNRQSHPIRLIHAINSLWCFFLYVGGILFLALVIFPLISLAQILFRIDARKLCLYLIETINRNIMRLSIGSKIKYSGFPKNMQGYIVVANHTNTVDIPLFNGMPFAKVTMVKWFWKFPVVKYLLKTAGFVRAPSPQEKFHTHEWEEECKELLEKGFNILFFPEGTRAKKLSMGRFRMGAFKLACSTQTPILPVCFYGNRWVMDKKRFVVRDCNLYASALPVIHPQNFDYTSGARNIARHTKKQMQQEYERLSIEETASKVQLGLVRDAYRYINPVFDLYIYFKLKYDKNYTTIVDLLPREGNILDVGCGIGFLSNLLVYSGEKRCVWGVDYSDEKINIAQKSTISYIANSLNFICENNLKLEQHFDRDFFDAVLCCDIMHYFTFEQQEQLLIIIKKLIKPSGVLVIRQDYLNQQEQSNRKKFELWAKFCHFNNFAQNELFYPSQEKTYNLLQKLGFQIEEISCEEEQKIIKAYKNESE